MMMGGYGGLGMGFGLFTLFIWLLVPVWLLGTLYYLHKINAVQEKQLSLLTRLTQAFEQKKD